MISRAFANRTFLTVWSFFPRSNSPSVQQGLGGGRCVVRSRHGHKGGRRRGSGNGDHGSWCLLHRDDYGGGVSLRDTEPLRQSREGAVWGFPSRRHAAICAWNAASKGGTSC